MRLCPDVAQRFVQAFPDEAELDVPLARYSGVGIGGPADVLLTVRDQETLLRAVQMAEAMGIPWRVYGGLTNVLLPDEGVRGLVILNRVDEALFGDEYRLIVAGGTSVVKVARMAVARGWGGLTWAVGLPGTFGGAIINNAGAFGGDISRLLQWAEVLGPGGKVQRVDAPWFQFGYRTSRLKGHGEPWVVLRAELQLRAAHPGHLRRKAQEYADRRKRAQPAGKTLGSTFKNPPGDYAGRLIEAAGLKGQRRGDVVVSTQHANFFINEGAGTAEDFCALVRLVRARVFEVFGIWLEPEVEILTESGLVNHLDASRRAQGT